MIERRMTWIYLVGVCLVGIYAAMFIPAISGAGVPPPYGLQSVIWNAAFFSMLGKKKGKSGWVGAIAGAAIGVAAFFLAVFLSAVIGGSS